MNVVRERSPFAVVQTSTTHVFVTRNHKAWKDSYSINISRVCAFLRYGLAAAVCPHSPALLLHRPLTLVHTFSLCPLPPSPNRFQGFAERRRLSLFPGFADWKYYWLSYRCQQSKENGTPTQPHLSVIQRVNVLVERPGSHEERKPKHLKCHLSSENGCHPISSCRFRLARYCSRFACCWFRDAQLDHGEARFTRRGGNSKCQWTGFFIRQGWQLWYGHQYGTVEILLENDF